ncbi:MAG: putative glycoside hydrolase, partial [Thermomicrobiales bacterium]
VYPSHFNADSIDVGGEPNDFPADVIAISMSMSLDKMDGEAGKLRPWLQDFSISGMTPYGPEQVRAQIDAAEEAGVEGWMLWNGGGGTNNEDALDPQ